MTDKLSPLVHFNPRAWNAFLKEIKDGRFDHTLAKGLLDKINSPSYWVDAAKTTGFANEDTFELFEKWLNLIEQGFIESPIKEKSRPEKIAELSAASSSEYFKESRDLFESIIESGDASFVESACLEYCRRLVRNGDFENAMDSAERIGDVGGQWSEKFSPYFERLSFWNLLSLERFEHAFALRTLIEESPRLIRFEFVEALEDEMEYLIYEIALSEISKSSAPEFAILLESLAKKLSKRGASELASSVNEARLGVLGEPEGH